MASGCIGFQAGLYCTAMARFKAAGVAHFYCIGFRL